MKYFVLIPCVMVMKACNSLGSLLFKKTMIRVKVFSMKETFTTSLLYIGIFLYAAGSVANIILMHFFDYSTVYPLTSLTCVWTLFFSHWLLKEKPTVHKFLGIGLIIAGAFLICI